MSGLGVKECHLAGRWYPAAPDQLATLVRDLLRSLVTPLSGVRAIVAPHAPYQSSGAVAGRAFAATRGPYRRAIVVGPSHHVAFRGGAVLPTTAYRTPLGVVPIDDAGVTALLTTPVVRPNPAVFLREHALEAQLPFLQVAHPGCAVVPLLIGRLEGGDSQSLTAVLGPLCTPDTLLVVSSDLAHYGRRFDYLPVPPTDAEAVAAALRRLDRGALDRMLAGDPEGFASYVTETGITICGRDPIGVLLRVLPRGARGHEIAYSTSVDATGEYEHAVGYGALAFTSGTA